MLRFAQHDRPMSFRASARNPVRGCLRSVQHDSRVVIPNTLFCHSERSEESSAWMLRFAQHDKLVDASLRNASFSMAVHLQDIKA